MDRIQFHSLIASDPLDIDFYLPIKSDEEAEAFCLNDDGLLELRKNATMRRVYAASNTEDMTSFVASVTDIFFHRSYQKTHRWPAKQ